MCDRRIHIFCEWYYTLSVCVLAEVFPIHLEKNSSIHAVQRCLSGLALTTHQFFSLNFFHANFRCMFAFHFSGWISLTAIVRVAYAIFWQATLKLLVERKKNIFRMESFFVCRNIEWMKYTHENCNHIAPMCEFKKKTAYEFVGFSSPFNVLYAEIGNVSVKFKQIRMSRIFFISELIRSWAKYNRMWKMLQFTLIASQFIQSGEWQCGIIFILIGYSVWNAYIYGWIGEICTHCSLESKYFVDAYLMSSKQIAQNGTHSQFSSRLPTKKPIIKRNSLAVPYRMACDIYVAESEINLIDAAGNVADIWLMPEIVFGSWFGIIIQKSLNETKQPQTVQRVCTQPAKTHTHPLNAVHIHNRLYGQMIDKVTITIKTLQWFHWDRLLLLLLFCRCV